MKDCLMKCSSNYNDPVAEQFAQCVATWQIGKKKLEILDELTFIQ